MYVCIYVYITALFTKVWHILLELSSFERGEWRRVIGYCSHSQVNRASCLIVIRNLGKGGIASVSRQHSLATLAMPLIANVLLDLGLKWPITLKDILL